MGSRQKVLVLGLAALCLLACEAPDLPTGSATGAARSANDADVIIVGAGLAGLAAAIDAANGGARVLVVDLNSVFGGHGIQSGGVAVVGSPMQAAAGYADAPDLAYDDWMAWTVDGHAGWTRYYVENSRRMIYDWLIPMGVRFDTVRPSHGNSVPRFHMTHRRGLNLLRPMYLEALRYDNIAWHWNFRAEELLKEDGRVVGVAGRDLRAGQPMRLRSHIVVLATGGFQSNIEMVTANWPEELPAPPQVWGMSGQYSRGDGHRMAVEAGAALVYLERQYNGYNALPNALDLDEDRGFVGGTPRSIWINAEGQRFVTEGAVDREVFPRAMRQQPRGHWAVFDADDKLSFGVLSPHFVTAEGRDEAKIQRVFVENRRVTERADTLEELAVLIGVPPDALIATVAEFNRRVAAGESTEIDGLPYEDAPPVFTIDTPPYYATKLYPLANKSAGGVSIDMSTRALDGAGVPVPGLYAAGELTGSAGMNGLHGLDGMFTGPAIMTGRVSGQSVVAELEQRDDWTPAASVRTEAFEQIPLTDVWDATLGPEQLAALLATPRDGYWHFERVHHLVLERGYACTDCHSSRVPFAPIGSVAGRVAQSALCDTCHLAPAGTVAEGAAERAPPIRD